MKHLSKSKNINTRRKFDLTFKEEAVTPVAELNSPQLEDHFSSAQTEN